ncbi:MAG: aminoacyl-tRNA hydrolase [Oscillospiraceae bacterium]|nr:aminoacyl-tRNA hydrolase [Oscillospiraceae bacterium]
MFFKKPSAGWLIAGLGNPGRRYELTRHNVGWLALESFAKKQGIRVNRARFSALSGTGRVRGESVCLIKPTTYMNNSGEAVAAAAKYFKLPPERIVVICDDISLAPGHLRIREKGSAGGHNGLRSIIDCLGSEDFIRIKIGIGDRPDRESELADWVLSLPTSAERKLIEGRFEDICAALELIIGGDTTLAQSRYNS